MTIGAKDQSNRLVAGFLRNFSKDSRWLNKFFLTKKESVVEQMIRGSGVLTALTYSQTPNALVILELFT